MSDRESDMDAWKTRLDKGDKPTEPAEPASPKVSDLFNQSPPKTVRTGNEKLAASAAQKLVDLNKGLAISLMMARMPGTALGISAEEENFREMAYNALLSDPSLCRTINALGSNSGKLTLLLAYGAMFGAVMDTAIAEYKAHPIHGYLERKRIERDSY